MTMNQRLFLALLLGLGVRFLLRYFCGDVVRSCVAHVNQLVDAWLFTMALFSTCLYAFVSRFYDTF